MDSPLVSVIIPTYNYGHFIEQAIRKVLDQTFSDFEILVVDDGSTDNTREVIAGFGDQVRYVWQPNSGQGAARNRGIKEARGEFIAFLDADDNWLAEKLERQIKVFQNDPELGLVYSLFYYFESESGAIVGYKPVVECFRGRVLSEMFQSCMIGSPTPLIRREVFDSVGLFREDLKGVEDYEMWLRICAEHKIDFVPEYLAMYRVHQSNCSNAFTLDSWLEIMTGIVAECYHGHPALFTDSDRRNRLFRLYQLAFQRAFLTGNKAQAVQFLRCAREQKPSWNHWLWWVAINFWNKGETDYNDGIASYQRAKILLAKGA